MNLCQCPQHLGHRAAYQECRRCGLPLCENCLVANYNIDTGSYVFGGQVCVVCHGEVMSILRSRGITPYVDEYEPQEESV